MIQDDLLASGYFSSFACTISSTCSIVYRIYNSVSNQDNHSKKRFMHIVDVLVQSAAVYSVALMVSAIATLLLVTTGGDNTLSLFAVINYNGNILYFVSVRTFGAPILDKVQ